MSFKVYADWDSYSDNGASLIIKTNETDKFKNYNYKIESNGFENDMEYVLISSDGKNISYAKESCVGSKCRYFEGEYNKIAEEYCFRNIKNEMKKYKFKSSNFSNFIGQEKVKYFCKTNIQYYQSGIIFLNNLLELNKNTFDNYCYNYEYQGNSLCNRSSILEFKNKLESLIANESNTDYLAKCLNLGFKKGTESLKNCVLELSR